MPAWAAAFLSISLNIVITSDKTTPLRTLRQNIPLIRPGTLRHILPNCQITRATPGPYANPKAVMSLDPSRMKNNRAAHRLIRLQRHLQSQPLPKTKEIKMSPVITIRKSNKSFATTLNKTSSTSSQVSSDSSFSLPSEQSFSKCYSFGFVAGSAGDCGEVVAQRSNSTTERAWFSPDSFDAVLSNSEATSSSSSSPPPYSETMQSLKRTISHWKM